MLIDKKFAFHYSYVVVIKSINHLLITYNKKIIIIKVLPSILISKVD